MLESCKLSRDRWSGAIPTHMTEALLTHMTPALPTHMTPAIFTHISWALLYLAGLAAISCQLGACCQRVSGVAVLRSVFSASPCCACRLHSRARHSCCSFFFSGCLTPSQSLSLALLHLPLPAFLVLVPLRYGRAWLPQISPGSVVSDSHFPVTCLLAGAAGHPPRLG